MLAFPSASASCIQHPCAVHDFSITPSTTTGAFVYAFGDASTVASATGFEVDTGAPRFTTSAAKIVVAASRRAAAMLIVFIRAGYQRATSPRHGSDAKCRRRSVNSNSDELLSS